MAMGRLIMKVSLVEFINTFRNGRRKPNKASKFTFACLVYRHGSDYL